MVFSMVAMYGYMPVAKADGLTSAKDTIGDSGLSATTDHVITFRPGVTLNAGTVITLDFDATFTGGVPANATCPPDATAGGVWPQVTCTVGVTDVLSTQDYTITVPDVTNPAGAGSKLVTISHDEPTTPESSQMLVYIISAVEMTAHVNASLTFAVAGTSTTGTVVNGITATNGTSTATAVDFGTLVALTPKVIAQTLTVSTNATAGYVVTMQHDHEMSNAAGADIDSYSSTTKDTWTPPAGTLAAGESSYGQISVTSSDSENFTGDNFGAAEFQGLRTSPLAVMGHNGPADGVTENVGTANVAFEIEITNLQEAGDYSNNVTYICTPTF